MAAPKSPNTAAARAVLAAKRAAEKRERGILAARVLLGEEGYLVLSREEVAEMLTKSIYREGLSAAWLRGYLNIAPL